MWDVRNDRMTVKLFISKYACIYHTCSGLCLYIVVLVHGVLFINRLYELKTDPSMHELLLPYRPCKLAPITTSGLKCDVISGKPPAAMSVKSYHVTSTGSVRLSFSLSVCPYVSLFAIFCDSSQSYCEWLNVFLNHIIIIIIIIIIICVDDKRTCILIKLFRTVMLGLIIDSCMSSFRLATVSELVGQRKNRFFAEI